MTVGEGDPDSELGGEDDKVGRGDRECRYAASSSISMSGVALSDSDELDGGVELPSETDPSSEALNGSRYICEMHR